MLFAGGIAVSFLVGKAPAALPVMRLELGLSLFQAGLVVSIYSLISGVSGAFFGMLADRFGHRKVALSGMTIAVLAGVAGAGATSPAFLLATRAIEGLGFFITVISLPALMLRQTTMAGRQKVMGLWSGYMPLGMGTMLLFGGMVVEPFGWRGLWIATSVLIGFVALAIALSTARQGPSQNTGKSAGAPPPVTLAAMKTVLGAPGPLLLALTFGSYASVFLIVTAFLPLLLVEQAKWQVASAASAGALVILANIAGCFASGLLLDMGIKRRGLIVTAAAIMAVCAIVLMTGYAPVIIRLAAAMVLSAVGGLIPGVLFSGVPVHAPSPAHFSTVNGLMLQGVAFGQLLGPAAASYVVGETGNWASALYVIVPLTIIAGGSGLALGRLERAK